MVGRPCTTMMLFRASDELSSSICKEPQNDKKSQRIEKIFSVAARLHEAGLHGVRPAAYLYFPNTVDMQIDRWQSF